jgi:hypothetical protein
MQYQFIVLFAYLVQHICHIQQQKSVKRGVPLVVSKGNMPFLQVITYEKAIVIPSDLLTVPRLCKTIVGIFHSRDHYAVAHIDPGKSRTITIYDGLYWELTTWMDNIVQLLKKCRLVHLNVVSIEVIGDSPTKLIVPGHRRGKEMVNGLIIIIEQGTIRGDFLTRTDGFNCGTIACLKVMELFQQIDLEKSQKCYKKGRIRAVVLKEWELLVDTCDQEGKLHVLDTRTEDTSVAKSEHSNLDYGDSSESSEIDILDILSINDENGLFFRPDCLSMCITKSHSHEHPCNKGHKMFFMRHSPTAETLSFFQEEHSIEAITTAMSRKLSLRQSRLRCSSHNHTRNSQKGKNESLQFYEVQNVVSGCKSGTVLCTVGYIYKG